MITTINTPRINTNDDQVEVLRWHVADGARVAAGDELVDMETSKAVVTLTAECAGYLRALVKAGTVVRVGAPLYACADTPEELAAANGEPTAAGTPGLAASTAFTTTRLSRAAQAVAAARGALPAGMTGLVTARRLAGGASASASRASQASPAVNAPNAFAATPGPPAARHEPVPLGKRVEAHALSTGESGNINSLLSVYFDSAPIRARLLREQAFDGNVQPLILFELSRLLKRWPQFTAYCEAGETRYYDRVDIGVAIDLGKGLKVVTFRDADRLLPIDFFEKTIDAGLRYLDNKLLPEELAGSTITVTDLSGFNVLHFHPLINGHQSAILGIGGDANRPGHPMSLNMTFDHRVSNGREVATFLGELRERLLSYGGNAASAGSYDMGPADALSFDTAPAATPPAISTPDSCDTCGIRRVDYYRDAGAAAYLLAYVREDGTLGCVCHRCYGGWL